MNVPVTPARRRPGGRTERTRLAVYEATLRLLGERGAPGFGIEELAREAGVHKTTVYRRWPTVEALLADVAESVIGQSVTVPYTGSLEGDLRVFARSIALLASDPVRGPALTALFTAPEGMTKVAEVIERFWAARLELLAPVTQRAILRGEVPTATSTPLLFEALGAPLYYRLLMTRRPIDDAAVERTVALTLLGARAGLFAEEPG